MLHCQVTRAKAAAIAGLGRATVQRYEEGAVVVLFESVGYKKLGVDMVLERGLLASVGDLPR